MVAQYESFNSLHFETVLTEVFSTLGFDTKHLGGPGQTDILLHSPVSAGAFRVVVDAKSNKNGKIADGNIDWNSVDDHRKAERADFAMVVAPGFSGGNLLKRADDYGVALMPAQSLAELLRLHMATPFSLVELRPIFECHGKVNDAIEQVRQTSQSNQARWQLLRALVGLIEQLPSGVFADAQKLWLLLSFQRREAAPSLEAVEDAFAFLSNRVVGILRPANDGREYALTMQSATAVARIGALARELGAGQAGEESQVARSESANEENPSSTSSGVEHVAPLAKLDSGAFLAAAQSVIVQRLQSIGFKNPTVVSARHLTIDRNGQSVGLAFRASKHYRRNRWWWTFTEVADYAPLAHCDSVVLVGLMAEPDDASRPRDSVLFLNWADAESLANQVNTPAWTKDKRLHIYVNPGSKWSKWVVPIEKISLP